MVMKRGGLGRNLSALLGPSEFITQGDHANVLSLEWDSLQPGHYQPRGDIDESALAELAQSIKQQGLLQPIVVRRISDTRYEIIAGERRWRACKLAGLDQVPALLRQVDNETAMAMALVENLQREDLNAIDQARAMHRLISEFGLTHQQIADLLSKSRTAVSNYLRLLNLNPAVRQLLKNNELDMGHAKCLLALEGDEQAHVAQLVVAKQLSVRETEALVNRVKAGPKAVLHKADASRLYREELDRLSQQLRTTVKLKVDESGKGKLIIQCNNTKTLEQVFEQLMLCASQLH